jgi:hypothetical protein
MKNGDETTRTAAGIRKDLFELLRQRAECESAVAAAATGVRTEALAAFRKEPGASQRRKEHQAAHTAALEELQHIGLVEAALKLELEAAERLEAAEDAKQHAREGRKQADELSRTFRALDHTMKTAVTAFRDARQLLDEVRSRGYFATSREQCDTLITDALATGLQGLNFSTFRIPLVEPTRRKSFTELGDRWSTAMRGRADAAINSPPPPPPPASSPPLPAVSSSKSTRAQRGDLSKPLAGDMALGNFRVYGSKAEADAAHARMKEGPSQ